MTREEAIEVLKKTVDNSVEMTMREWEEFDKLMVEAIDMAIEALQADAVRRKDTVTLDSPISIQAEMVAVVWCKDCKHRSYEGWCDVYIQPRMDTDFCNHGERQCNYFGEAR